MEDTQEKNQKNSFEIARLNELYLRTKSELDEYKVRVNKEASDKMGELEMHNKILKEEL